MVKDFVFLKALENVGNELSIVSRKTLIVLRFVLLPSLRPAQVFFLRIEILVSLSLKRANYRSV
jgi:hypothetical protein